MKELGVFPLPIFLLPGGVTQLRIFEPRYIRLVKEAIRGEGFALAFYQKGEPFQCYPIASLVEIIDFSSLDDGFLGITIKAKGLIKLHHFKSEEDGLLKAKTSAMLHWPQQKNVVQEDQIAKLAQTLGGIISTNEALKKIYPEPQLDNQHWVCARFIELLPLSFERKKNFILPQSFEQCVNFLHTIIIGDNNT